jgi:Protein of unknown function (DUF998)
MIRLPKKLPISARIESSVRSKNINKVLIACGIAASLLYVLMNIVCAAMYKEYSSVSQTVSELSAIDAPSRNLWVPLGILYSSLMTAFAIGIIRSSLDNRKLYITGILLFIYAMLGFFWPPMHLRGIKPSLTDEVHIIFAALAVLVMMLSMGFGAFAFGKKFRLYSFVTMFIIILFGTLTSLEAPGIARNLPTPRIGVWERINIGIFLLWIIVLSITLMKKTRN